jgi:hypothetical protein
MLQCAANHWGCGPSPFDGSPWLYDDDDDGSAYDADDGSAYDDDDGNAELSLSLVKATLAELFLVLRPQLYVEANGIRSSHF